MTLGIRKISTFLEETHVEGGKAAPRPVTMVVVAAVIQNPWAGRGFVENLRPEIIRIAGELSHEMTNRLLRQMDAEKIEACGKAAAVGINGEIEHASALIHTLRFGNHYRQAVGAKSYLAFSNTRGPACAPIMIPLMDKNDEGRRSHYLTIQTSIPDAPAADEIVVALGASVGGRPHHRIGDRYQDLRDLGQDVANPAGV